MGIKNHDDGDEIISDINVTPFVDVALVLLIIFMVTATYIVAKSIPVDLPEAKTGEDVVTTYAITVTEKEEIYVDGIRLSESELSKKIRGSIKDNADVRVVIAADKKVSHGVVVRIIDLVRREGVVKFAINIESKNL